MRIIESAEGAYGATVIYEHNGETFQMCGSSVSEIKQRLNDQMNSEFAESEDTAIEPEPGPADIEEAAETEPEDAQDETETLEVDASDTENDQEPEGNENDSER